MRWTGERILWRVGSRGAGEGNGGEGVVVGFGAGGWQEGRGGKKSAREVGGGQAEAEGRTVAIVGGEDGVDLRTKRLDDVDR